MQLSTVSRLKHDHFVELIGYCLESNNRILVYQYASLGSLHDILHGIACYSCILILLIWEFESLFYFNFCFLFNLIKEGKEYKGLNLVQFLIGTRELKLHLEQPRGLNFCTKRFSLRLFIEMSGPAMSCCLRTTLPKLPISI